MTAPGSLRAEAVTLIHDDMLRAAAEADRQGRDADAAGHYMLAVACYADASARRRHAETLARYATDPYWQART